MDLEFGKSQIEKEEKKIAHGFATKFTFFCLFLGGRLRIYYGIFCNYDTEEPHSNASS